MLSGYCSSGTSVYNRGTFVGIRLQTLRFRWGARLLRTLLFLLTAIAITYAAFGAFMWRTMRQPPEDFARVMAKMPGPVVFLLFPFETLWLHARAGTLHFGDPAPDFSLQKLDHSGPVQLSVLNSQKPVVLVFGSYT
jgi:hypothetical protein